MRPLTILQVAFSLAAVGPDAVGGSEQVLSTMDHAVVAAGHRSVVVACEGSVTAGELVSFPGPPPGEPITEAATIAARTALYWAMDSVLGRGGIDLVHMHGLDYHTYLPPPGVPVLATLHLPPDWYPAEIFTPWRPDTWLTTVSQRQAAACPPSRALLPPIANGVPVDALAAGPARRCGYALMLARVCPEKGLHLALDAAHEADVPLLIGGELFPYPAHQEYFAREVAPRLDRRRRWLGPLAFPRKRRLLAGARCVLVPSLVAETSSLVAMEAAACGTPVVALRHGALPEVVEDGVTGLLVDAADGLADAIRHAGMLDRGTIRDVAQRRFSRDRMAAEYLARYAELAGQTVAA